MSDNRRRFTVLPGGEKYELQDTSISVKCTSGSTHTVYYNYLYLNDTKVSSNQGDLDYYSFPENIIIFMMSMNTKGNISTKIKYSESLLISFIIDSKTYSNYPNNYISVGILTRYHGPFLSNDGSPGLGTGNAVLYYKKLVKL